ncbi:MAG TPA: transglutaminase family protein, partial [Rhabdochlamydiaceae bacterium]|nr:transglutaminase family protein [Rhabdochlamydiaceae bacterium]
MHLLILILVFTFASPLSAKRKNRSPQPIVVEKNNVKSLFSSLDPYSLAQHLAFYELYKETEEGKKALAHAWKLLSHGTHTDYSGAFPLPQIDIQAIVSLVTRQSFDPPVALSEEQLKVVHSLASHFSNRKLKGCSIWTKEELLQLPAEETDLGRALLINQFDEEENIKDKILQYEASLDLMALQIFVRLPKQATAIDKIREINRFIFQEMRFRFPPHSLYAKDIDLYTFLPSVLDNRQGVCLGVSILYLCLAQRLDLPLEIITPPGHIFVRWENGTEAINIETTARGINPPDETYLGLNTRLLQRRTIKEVVGMAFVNQASV